MPQFRKKPVVVSAFRLGDDWPDWWTAALDARTARMSHDCASIETLEGTHRADWGDWIIQGTRGEIYPCKPSIFVEIYEPVA
jgi:hypothetical protein